jgi:hypothetical protein
MTTQEDIKRFEQRYSERNERQRLKGLWWAVVLIWAGLVIAADGMGLVPQIGDATAWNWIFLGAGMVGVLGSFYRLTLSNVPNPTAWDWVWAGICLIIGLSDFITLNIFLPLILILVGALSLVNGLRLRD